MTPRDLAYHARKRGKCNDTIFDVVLRHLCKTVWVLVYLFLISFLLMCSSLFLRVAHMALTGELS